MSRDIYFNENDAYPAQWLRNLYPDAHVDERSIADVQGEDVAGYERCHFFGGIGGWQYALDLAGWPAGTPVWTGSCPCQPFSVAGAGGGFSDERHLWPKWFDLIREQRPATIFGEQVASPAGLAWLDLVSTDLEGEGYAFAAADLCAAGAGAPHIRQRLWWVAIAQGPRGLKSTSEANSSASSGEGWNGLVGGGAFSGGMAFCARQRFPERYGAGFSQRRSSAEAMGYGDTADAAGSLGRLGDPKVVRRARDGVCEEGWRSETGDTTSTPWSNYDLVHCLDGKSRRIEPGTFPLAHGVPARVGRLRAYGNAIVPQVAATFVRAFMEVEHETEAP